MRIIRAKTEKEIINRTIANFIIVRNFIYSSNLDARQECECIDQLIDNTFEILSVFNAENFIQQYLDLNPCTEDNIGRIEYEKLIESYHYHYTSTLRNGDNSLYVYNICNNGYSTQCLVMVWNYYYTSITVDCLS